jgi:hypothetical protein
VLVKGEVSPGLCLACAYAAMAVAGASLTSIASGLVTLGSSSDSAKDAGIHEVYQTYLSNNLLRCCSEHFNAILLAHYFSVAVA